MCTSTSATIKFSNSDGDGHIKLWNCTLIVNFKITTSKNEGNKYVYIVTTLQKNIIQANLVLSSNYCVRQVRWYLQTSTGNWL
jgi:hypothetical protein